MQTLLQLRNGALDGATSIKLSEGLTHFPEEIFRLSETLEVLDLSQNKLQSLPENFGCLKKLKVLFCSDNLFTTLPEVLADCPLIDIVGFKANSITYLPPRALNPNLRWLILTNNQIAALPPEIGNCTRMQKLMLAGNVLPTLPEELQKCRNLQLLRISANRLSLLPEWLLALPKLSWLAFSGNKFNITLKPIDVPAVPWKKVAIEAQLGEGASGIIYRGEIRDHDEKKQIAVKVFKGNVTSDGLPKDERDAFLAAGIHPGLVPLLGVIEGHPEGKEGLVMDLIAASFYNLGGPPSLASCTRDTFTKCKPISLTQVLHIAGTIVSVGMHLHSIGIMHGDLYAHNTLIDDNGTTLLGDFGAASLYDKNDLPLANALERLEVSAFGYLLDDLLQLCNEKEEGVTLSKLKIIRDATLAPEVLARPGFQELQEMIIALRMNLGIPVA